MLHFFETTGFYIFCTLSGDNSHDHLHSRKRYTFRRSCFVSPLSVQKTQIPSSQKLLKMPVAFQWSLNRWNTPYLPDHLPKCGVFATNDLSRKHLPQVNMTCSWHRYDTEFNYCAENPVLLSKWNKLFTKNCCFTSIEDPRLQQLKNYCPPFKLQDGGLLPRCLNFCKQKFLVTAKKFYYEKTFFELHVAL